MADVTEKSAMRGVMVEMSFMARHDQRMRVGYLGRWVGGENVRFVFELLSFQHFGENLVQERPAETIKRICRISTRGNVSRTDHVQVISTKTHCQAATRHHCKKGLETIYGTMWAM
jgi:hypothetical protein